MDMNKSFRLRKEDRDPKWWVIDAEGQILGRLATKIADTIRGKNKAIYSPDTDAGDYVIVLNADKVKLTGNKLEEKIYDRYTGWMGGYKTLTAQQMFEKKPTFVVEHAVKGMLPKNKLNREIIKKLKVYVGAEHPHVAQNPEKLSI